MRFFVTHSGRATLGVSAAVWLIAWPPPDSWVLAAFILLWSVGHLRAAFSTLGETHSYTEIIDVPARIEPHTLRRVR